jgi:hypothetical protein
MKTQAPIFIVGYFHTGSSLLQSILGREPSLYVATSESHFFQDLPQIRREFPDLQDEAVLRDYLGFLIRLIHMGFFQEAARGEKLAPSVFGISDDRFEAIVADARNQPHHDVLFGVVMDHLAAGSGKSRWLEKTPEHVHAVDTILALWPDARIIALVRDPRGTLASRKVRQTDEEWLSNKEQQAEVFLDGKTNFDPVLDSFMWKESVSAGAEAARRHPDNVLVVRYETMVSEPEATLRRVCEFTGLRFDPDMLNVGWVNSATQKQKEGQAGGISASAVEKWRRLLTPSEVYVCQMLLRREMETYAYAPVDVPLGARLNAPVLAGKTSVNFVRRVSGRPGRMSGRARQTIGRLQRRVLKNTGFSG